MESDRTGGAERTWPGAAIEIRRATTDDADAVLKLCHLAYQSEAQLYDDWSLPPLLERYRDVVEAIEHDIVLVAHERADIVGSVRGRWRDHILEVGRLAVHPRRQRRGIGARLLAAIETHATDAKAFQLFTGDRSEANVRLYRRHGYLEIRRDVVSPALTLIVMEKRRPEAT